MLEQRIQELKGQLLERVDVLKAETHAEVDLTLEWLREMAQKPQEGPGEHDVSRAIWTHLLQLGLKMEQYFIAQVGPGDLGESAELDDGRVVSRLDLVKRRLVTVFGEILFERCVYGTRAGQKYELIPTDQRLQLPDSEMSFLLQEWDQLLGLDSAFGGVREVMQTLLGIKQSVATLELTNQQMAAAVPEFLEAQAAPDPKAEGELLIVTEDNKGIPMVRPVEEPRPAGHPTKGQKKNKKRMACVGCVYSVDRQVRTPEELVATLFRDDDRPRHQPPEAKQKRYRAELTRELDGEVRLGQTQVFEALRDQIQLRRQPGQTLVNLSDGQRSLETDRREYLPQDEHTVDVLDLMHVLPRVWRAAHLFHREGSAEAERFVRERLLQILRGQLPTVIRSLRQLSRKLTKPKQQELAKVLAFWKHNAHRMKYDEYLAAGYPIATGVIEGACRHLVKDRMERSGMRWKVPGAQAMLHLRAVYANGDWTTYQAFRVTHETERLYPNRSPLKNRDWPCLVNAA